MGPEKESLYMTELRAPKQNRRQLHQSGVNMFNKCGMQFAFRYIQGIRRPPNAFLLCGTATDKAVTWDLDTKILKGELATLAEVTDLARDSVMNDDRRDSIQLDPDDKGKSIKQVIDATKDKAVRLVTKHHGYIAPLIQPWRTARKFTVNLDNFLRARAVLLQQEADSPELSPWRKTVMIRQAEALNAAADEGLDFVGEQDIVEKFQVSVPGAGWDENPGRDVLNVRDTKTTGKSKNQGDADNDDQLTAYATASMVIDGRLPDKLILDVLVDLKRETNAQRLETTRGPLDVDIYLNRIANAVGAIQQGIFVPTQQTNWWCSEKWCAYTEHCPYFRKTRRPGSEFVEGLSGQAEDLLPILNKSVVLARKDDSEDE
jgi:hypothetical protein